VRMGSVLVDCGSQVGLECCFLKTFEDWMGEYCGNRLSEDEKEASFLYSSFGFTDATSLEESHKSV
jgi:hypothetical protein